MVPVPPHLTYLQVKGAAHRPLARSGTYHITRSKCAAWAHHFLQVLGAARDVIDQALLPFDTAGYYGTVLEGAATGNLAG